jgi:polysaccharide biosynthesis transport protein
MFENERSLVRFSRDEISMPTGSAIERGRLSQRQMSIVDIWHMVKKRKLAILGLTTIIFCAVAFYTFLENPIYEGVARLQIDPTRSYTLGLDDDDKSNAINALSRVKTEVSIIQSDAVAIQVMNSLRLYANPHFAGEDVVASDVKELSQLDPSQRQRLIEKFRRSLTVAVIPDTDVVVIRFRNTDPIIASDAANSVIDQYMQRSFNVHVEGVAQVSQWVSRQVDEIKAGTVAAQEKLADFKRSNNLLGGDETDNIVIDRLKQLNGELTQAEADRIIKEGRYRIARSGNPELIESVVPDTTLQVLRSQEAELEAEYAQLSAKFGGGYPKVREVQSQLAQLHSAIDTEGGNIQTRLSNEYEAAAKAEAMIRDNFDRQKESAYKLNESVAQYAILKHEVESGQQLYDTLQLKLKEAGITSGLNSSYVDIIDRAQLPTKPIAPMKTENLLIGLGAGLACGLFAGFVLDSFDDRVRSPEAIESVTAMPELVAIPFVRSLAKSDKTRASAAALTSGGPGFNPICVQEPNCMGAEAYRSLCSVILLSSLKVAMKVLVVTSATPNEGKSTVSCNLATALAQRGRRVLLVDADLRCSSIGARFGSGPGLSAILADPTEYPVYRPLSNLPSLHVIPAGPRPRDPVELLDSARMKKFLTAWQTEYDHIIIDTPPVLPFSDALPLAAGADGVILVTRSGVSRSKALLRAKEVLSRSGANVLGFVLNAVREPEYYYYYPAKYLEGATSNHSSAPPSRM